MSELKLKFNIEKGRVMSRIQMRSTGAAGIASSAVLTLLMMATGCGSSKPATTGTSGASGTTGTGVDAAAGTGESDLDGGVAGASPDASSDASSDGARSDGVIGPLTIQVSATGHDRFYGVAWDAAGSLYAVGQVTTSVDTNADVATVVAKLTPSGALDPTFGTGGLVVRNLVIGTNGELCRGIVVQTTGKVVISCTVEHVGAADARDRDIAVARFDASGAKDPAFGTDGILTLDLSTGALNGTAFSADSAWGLARYADDRLVIHGGQVRAGGVDTDFALIRLSADGARDATFGTNGVVTLDTQTAGVSQNASPRNVTILPGTDGLIGAGYQPLAGGDTKPALYKVSDTGVLDATFGAAGVFSTVVLAEQAETYEAKVQPDATGTGYKLVTTGYGRQLDTETTDVLSMRLTSAGVLDTTYGPNGTGYTRIDVGGFADNSRRLVVLPDRRIMLFGGGRKTAADVDGLVALLGVDGVPDKSWSPTGWRTYDLGGPADFLWSAALSPDSKTVAAVGIRGVGTTPATVGANDDASLLLLPVP